MQPLFSPDSGFFKFTQSSLYRRTGLFASDRTIELGIVREVRDYVKRDHIEIRTDNGWYYIERNESLEILLGDTLGLPNEGE